METSTADFIVGLLNGRPRIATGLNWDSVLTQTEAYRLGGLAWSMGSLGSAGSRGSAGPWVDQVPTGVLTRWEAAYRRQALSNVLLLEELERLRALFEGHSLALGVVKGGQLLDSGTYPLGARAADDLDIVLPEASGAAAVRLMLDAGWEPWSKDVLETVGWCDSAAFHLSGQGKSLGLSVDVHWRTSYDRLRYGVPGAGASHEWDQRGGLSPELHLALTLEHFLKHLRYRTHLVALADAVRLGSQVQDWAVVERALQRSAWGDAALALLAGLEASLDQGFLPPALRRRGRPGLRVRLNPQALVLSAGRPKRRLAGVAFRWVATGPKVILRDLLDSVAPPVRWLERRYGGGAGRGPNELRAQHLSRVFRWGIGIGPSPLSPNQD